MRGDSVGLCGLFSVRTHMLACQATYVHSARESLTHSWHASVGPASYRKLSDEAAKYMREAISGKPTLEQATKAALEADAKT